MASKRRIQIAASVLVGLSWWTGLGQGELLTVTFTAEVTKVADPDGVLAGHVDVGDQAEGAYTYDRMAGAGGDGPCDMGYTFRSARRGIVLQIGALTFQTDPRWPEFHIEITNDVSCYDLTDPADTLRVESWFDVPPEIPGWRLGLCSTGVYFYTDEPPLMALTSCDLPTSAPVLADWEKCLFRLTGTAQAEQSDELVHFDVEGRLLSVASFVVPPAVLEVGSDSEAGYVTIQAGIEAATDGDTVLVYPGVHTGQGNRDVDFQGKAVVIRSLDPNDWNVVAETIIDCEGSENQPHRGFHFRTGEGPESVVEGLTITGGYARDHGGAILCEAASSPTICKCIIADNKCGISASRGGEREGGHGAGIACIDDSHSIVQDCIISSNATGSLAAAGGGVYCGGSSVVISNCWLVGNTSGEGGGIYSLEASPFVSGCTIERNRAEVGGAVHGSSLNGRVYVINCVIRDNVADLSGGGVACGSNLTLAGCLIADNEAVGEDDSWSRFMRTPRGGGGIRLGDGGCVVANCTISGNTAFSGSGVLTGCVNDRPGEANFHNCIIWDNSGGDRNQFVVSECCIGCVRIIAPITVRVHGSCVQGVVTKPLDEHYYFLTYVEDANCTHFDPRFVDADRGDFRLRPDSPYIDAIDKEPLAVLNSLDADGRPRVLDGDGDGVARLDLGAYELDMAVGAVIVTVPGNPEVHVYDGAPTATETLSIGRRGRSDDGGWAADCNAPWLDIWPRSGEAGDIVTLTADGTGLAPGLYRCDLELRASWAANSPLTVPVQLHVSRMLRVPAACGTLQEAMDVAQTGDVITLADGLYTGPGNEYVRCSVPGLTIRSENGPDNCIIDCNNVSYERRSGIWVIPAGTDLLVEGVTITRASGAPYITGANTTLLDCHLMDSRCSANGALLRAEGCRFDEVNLQAYYADVEIRKCEIAGAGSIISGTRSRVLVGDTSIHHCTYGPIRMVDCPEAVFWRCVISGNGYRRYGGLMPIENTRSELYLRNCTVVGNTGSAGESRSRGMQQQEPGTTYVLNSIFWDNRHFDHELLSSFQFAFSNVESIPASGGAMGVDPLFAAPGYWDENGTPEDVGDDFWVDGDYHLKSQAGRWDPAGASWVVDDVTSPCIDAGDPNRPVGEEPEPNGGRINMGAYGGTIEASKTP